MNFALSSGPSREYLTVLSYILPLALALKISVDMEDLFRPPIHPDLAFDQFRKYAHLVGRRSIEFVRHLGATKTNLSDKPAFCLGFTLLAALAVGQISSVSPSSDPRLASDFEALQECMAGTPKGLQVLLAQCKEPRETARAWKKAFEPRSPLPDAANMFDLDEFLATDPLPVGIWGDMASVFDMDWPSILAGTSAEPFAATDPVAAGQQER